MTYAKINHNTNAPERKTEDYHMMGKIKSYFNINYRQYFHARLVAEGASMDMSFA